MENCLGFLMVVFACLFVCLKALNAHFWRIFLKTLAREEIIYATVTLFPWSHPSYTTLALDQSALEKSPSHCRIVIVKIATEYVKLAEIAREEKKILKKRFPAVSNCSF